MDCSLIGETKMRLKKDVSTVNFINRVEQCTGEVIYETAEGDRLNLKSQLSKYLFLVAVNSEDSAGLREGVIRCEPEDAAILQEYLDA